MEIKNNNFRIRNRIIEIEIERFINRCQIGSGWNIELWLNGLRENKTGL